MELSGKRNGQLQFSKRTAPIFLLEPFVFYGTQCFTIEAFPFDFWE